MRTNGIQDGLIGVCGATIYSYGSVIAIYQTEFAITAVTRKSCDIRDPSAVL